MEYRFKQNRVAQISQNISIGILLTGIIGGLLISFLSLFIKDLNAIYGLGVFIISIPLQIPLIILHSLFTQRPKFTINFIEEIKKDLGRATTIEELKEIQDKLYSESVDQSGMIRLSFPGSIKELMREIRYKIEILEKQ
jgi:hypothetical protein